MQLLSISIVSLNARGLRDNVKRKALFLYAKSFQTDFSFFPESHSVFNDSTFWKKQWGNEVWMAHVSEHSAGVMIMKNHFAGSVLQNYIDPKGHFLLLLICVTNTFILLTNIYGYNTSPQKMLFEEIGEKNIVMVLCISRCFDLYWRRF